MTPMVDLGFLLVTFFMLTSQFRPEEPVEAITPGSIAETKLPEKDMMLITVDKDNRVFFTIDGQEHRKEALKLMGQQYKIDFTDAELNKFSNLSSFGVPIGGMKQWLSLDGSELKNYPQPGINVTDSLNRELFYWVIYSKRQALYNIAIKGDRKASYKTIRRIIDILGEHKIYKFNLVTDMKIE